MSHNEWYKYAYVDYFSSFLKLWIAFNSWYEQNYIKEEIKQQKLKDWYQALKSEIINPFDILKSKGVIDDDWDKIVLKNISIQRKDDFLNEFREIIEEKALEFWSILVLDKLWDRKYVEKVWDDYNWVLTDLLSDINFSKNLYDFRDKIDDLYDNDKRINYDTKQEDDILNFISNIVKDSNIEFQCYLRDDLDGFDTSKFQTKQWLRTYNLFLDMKDDLMEYPLIEQLWEIVNINTQIEYNEEIWKNDNILFLDWFSLKTILLLVYFVRNKLVHWELNPSNDKHYEIIKLSFYIMDYIFKFLTKE